MSRVGVAVRRLRAPRRLLAAGLAAMVLALTGAGVAVATSGSSDPTHMTLYFSRTVGLYNGNDVRILGVKVGKISSLHVIGTVVKVDVKLDGSNKLPADAQAVIIPPNLVSDRYIQLQPAYTSGPELKNGAVLGCAPGVPSDGPCAKQTAVPLEYDDIFKNLDQLNVAIGPNGANKHGALNALINTSAKNLKGNGTQLNSALNEFANAIATLSGNRGDLFSTVTSLQKFTTTLANDDGGVRNLNANLAQVGNQLSGERKDLGAALANLSTALNLVNGFIGDNRSTLTNDLHGFRTVSQTLQNEKEAITQLVDDAGAGVINLSLAGDTKVALQQKAPNGESIVPLDTKADLTQPLTSTGKSGALCQLFTSLGEPKLCKLVKALPIGKLPLSTTSSADTAPGQSLTGMLAVKR